MQQTRQSKATAIASLLVAQVLILAMLVTGCGRRGDGSAATIQAKFASEELEGDFMTVWANRFADAMRESSEGDIEITVFPFGTLGDTRDINELAQLGVIEFVFSDFAWISSFVPEAQVLLLHYIWPRERLPEVLDWVARHGESLDVLEAAFRRNGLVPLGLFFEGWQWLTAKRPVTSLDDMRGLKVRVMGSRLLVENYRAYGMVPTPMNYGEVYSGLQMGLIDAQVNPIFALRSMKFYEVQDYFVQLWAEPFIGIPTANARFFDSLEPAVQQDMRDWWREAILPSAAWIEARNAEDLEAILTERPQIEVLELTPEQTEPFKALSRPVYDSYLDQGGDDAQRMLEALLQDIENAKAALGIE